MADVDSSTISYVETHGTGTPLGDPIEIDGLRQAFGVSERTGPGPCVLGSVKSNIGHLEVASGIAGLIKTILCLKNRAIPADPALHQPQPGTASGAEPVRRAERVRRLGVPTASAGPGSARSASAAPMCTSSSKRRRRFRRATAPPARRCSCCRPEPPRRSTNCGPRWPPSCRPDEPGPVRRRVHPRAAAGATRSEWRPSSHDQQHAAAVLEAAEHDNIFVGECRRRLRIRRTRHGWFSCSPGRARSTPGWPAACTTSEPVFAENFDRCAEGFAEELGIDLRAEVFDGPGRTWSAPTRPSPPCSRWNTRSAQLIDVVRRRARGAGRAQHRRVRGGHHGGCVRPADGDQGRCRCARV